MNHVSHPLNSDDISIFSQKSANFVTSRNTVIDCILYTHFEYLKIVLKNMVPIFMISAKMAKNKGILKAILKKRL